MGTTLYADKVREKAYEANSKEHQSPEFRLLFHFLIIWQSKDLKGKKGVKQTIDAAYHTDNKLYTCTPIQRMQIQGLSRMPFLFEVFFNIRKHLFFLLKDSNYVK